MAKDRVKALVVNENYNCETYNNHHPQASIVLSSWKRTDEATATSQGPSLERSPKTYPDVIIVGSTSLCLNASFVIEVSFELPIYYGTT